MRRWALLCAVVACAETTRPNTHVAPVTAAEVRAVAPSIFDSVRLADSLYSASMTGLDCSRAFKCLFGHRYTDRDFAGAAVTWDAWRTYRIWPVIPDSSWVWSDTLRFNMFGADTMIATRVRIVAMVAGVAVVYELERTPRSGKEGTWGQFDWVVVRPRRGNSPQIP